MQLLKVAWQRKLSSLCFRYCCLFSLRYALLIFACHFVYNETTLHAYNVFVFVATWSALSVLLLLQCFYCCCQSVNYSYIHTYCKSILDCCPRLRASQASQSITNMDVINKYIQSIVVFLIWFDFLCFEPQTLNCIQSPWNTPYRCIHGTQLQ